MPYAVVLHFEPLGEAGLAALQADVARAVTTALETRPELSSAEYEQVYRPLPPNLRPHISLAGFEGLPEGDFCRVIGEFAADQPPVEISLESAGAFPGSEGVVFVSPSFSPGLLDIHSRFFAGPARLAHAPSPYYIPGRWAPHVTTVIGLPPPLVGEIVELCRQSSVFGPCRLVSIALLSHPPIEVLCEFPLCAPPRLPDQPQAA